MDYGTADVCYERHSAAIPAVLPGRGGLEDRRPPPLRVNESRGPIRMAGSWLWQRHWLSKNVTRLVQEGRAKGWKKEKNLLSALMGGTPRRCVCFARWSQQASPWNSAPFDRSQGLKVSILFLLFPGVLPGICSPTGYGFALARNNFPFLNLFYVPPLACSGVAFWASYEAVNGKKEFQWKGREYSVGKASGIGGDRRRTQGLLTRKKRVLPPLAINPNPSFRAAEEKTVESWEVQYRFTPRRTINTLGK